MKEYKNEEEFLKDYNPNAYERPSITSDVLLFSVADGTQTNYRKLKTSNEYSLIEFRLETGRTNQIRVQMASVGHPVVGDRKYGLGVSTIMNSLALHAHLLVFEHPVSHQKMTFKLPIPKEFMKVFR